MSGRVRRTLRQVLSGRAALAAILLAAVVTWTPPEQAGPAPDARPAIRASTQADRAGATGALTFVSQTPWRIGDQPAQLSFRVNPPGDPAALEVALAVYPRLTSRIEFAQTLDDRVRRSALSLQRFPVPSLVADPTGLITLPLDAPVSRQGVYPVRVELRDPTSGDVIDAFTTHLVHLPAPIEGVRLGVGLALPFTAPLATQPDGDIALAEPDLDRLGDVADALAESKVPLTVLPKSETVDALANGGLAEGRTVLTALSAAAQGRIFLARHYVDTSLPSLLDAGLADEAERQQVRAAAAIGAQVSGAQVATDTWVSDQALDDEALVYLRDRGVKKVVVPEASLAPLDLPITLTQTFEVRAGDRTLAAAANDPELRSHFTREENPALGAQHLLADLAVLYFDRPGLTRGVAVAAPDGWEASGPFVATLLAGLDRSPILEAQTLSSLFEEVPPLTRGSTTVVRPLADADGADRVALRSRSIRTVRARLQSLVSVLSPFNPIVERIDRTLLAAQSSQLRARDRAEMLAGADAQIEDLLSKVSLPGNRSITLTAREGEIPITITSDIPYTINAALRLRSGTLSFPRGEIVPVELARSNLTQRVTVRANTSGSFPLRVELVSPDGQLVLGETRVTVRSTAVSGVGIALSVGAALFLALWWARHLHGRRSKRLVPT